MTPIFIGITRSFWAGTVSVLMALAMLDPTVLHAAVSAVLRVLRLSPADAASAADLAVSLAPVLAALGTGVALHQRSGSARPYTTRASAETMR